MIKKFLNKAYGLETTEQTQKFYKDWAASYDEEVQYNGYASPTRTAMALKASGANLNAPMLDIGCGTGLSGHFLKQAGFEILHGSDMSEEMLAKAREKSIYDALFLAKVEDPFDYIKITYPTIAAIGLFSPGHAPAQSLPRFLELLPKSGLLGFSLNDHALDDPSYMQNVNALISQKRARLRWQDYGDHLPKIGLNSTIIVLERI